MPPYQLDTHLRSLPNYTNRHFGIYDDAKELLQSADTNGDGMIDYTEFSWLLRNQSETLKNSARTEVKGQLSKFI